MVGGASGAKACYFPTLQHFAKLEVENLLRHHRVVIDFLNVFAIVEHVDELLKHR